MRQLPHCRSIRTVAGSFSNALFEMTARASRAGRQFRESRTHLNHRSLDLCARNFPHNGAWCSVLKPHRVSCSLIAGQGTPSALPSSDASELVVHDCEKGRQDIDCLVYGAYGVPGSLSRGLHPVCAAAERLCSRLESLHMKIIGSMIHLSGTTVL
ncbi:hypothetical protein BDU57DRAFT_1549 [Ampelomyces quisqualis]|uniref:Uncharacterized protein n=1 Tax=Ampelomyces quisqualis TaxID=50730 RepID=A0A6A5QW67_AMPQU|nr:hypothetical protein BDU57DRAFT_1549 [Ampelomyces quisqualis]